VVPVGPRQSADPAIRMTVEVRVRTVPESGER
jgi:hypothetical protein